MIKNLPNELFNDKDKKENKLVNIINMGLKVVKKQRKDIIFMYVKDEQENKYVRAFLEATQQLAVEIVQNLTEKEELSFEDIKGASYLMLSAFDFFQESLHKKYNYDCIIITKEEQIYFLNKVSCDFEIAKNVNELVERLEEQDESI